MGNPQDNDRDAPLASESASPGQRLRQSRETRQLTRDAVAAQMRVETRVIDALERDDYTQLPAAVFVRGYLRTYAKLVGLPAEPIVESFDHRTAQAPPRLVLPTTIGTDLEPHSRYARWIVLVLAIVSVVLFYQWWHQNDGKSAPVVAPPVTVPQSAPQPPPQTDESYETPVVVPAPGPGTRLDNLYQTPTKESGPSGMTAMPAATAPEPITTASAASAATPAPPVVTTASVTTAPQSVTAALPQTTSDADTGPLVMHFTADSWVVVRDAGGRTLLQGLIKSGQRRVLDGKAPFQVTLGNSPVVEIEYQGQRFDQSRYTGASRVARFTLGK